MKLKTHLSNWAQVLATKPRYWLYLLLSIIVAAIFTLQSGYLAKLTTAVGPQSSAAGTVKRCRYGHRSMARATLYMVHHLV